MVADTDRLRRVCSGSLLLCAKDRALQTLPAVRRYHRSDFEVDPRLRAPLFQCCTNRAGVFNCKSVCFLSFPDVNGIGTRTYTRFLVVSAPGP